MIQGGQNMSLIVSLSKTFYYATDKFVANTEKHAELLAIKIRGKNEQSVDFDFFSRFSV